jgi:hypothetical protein
MSAGADYTGKEPSPELHVYSHLWDYGPSVQRHNLSVSHGRARCLIKVVPYLSGSFFALVGGSEDVELCATSREGALVNVHSAQVNIDTTGSPARKNKRVRTKCKIVLLQPNHH